MRKLLAAVLFMGAAALGLAQSPDMAVGEVAGKPVLKSYFDVQWALFVRSTLQQQGLPYAPELEAQLAPAKAGFLERVIQDVAVVVAAERAGLAPKAEAVEAVFADQKGQFDDEASFNEALANAGIPSVASFKQLIYESLAYNALAESVASKVKISEAALQIIYQLSKNEYGVDERYCAAHILVETREDYDKVRADLVAGKSFAEVAKTYSQDGGSANDGGSLGCEPAGTYVEPFEVALLALKAGEMTKEPVQTEFGFHVIVLQEVIPSTVLPFSEVRSDFEQPILQGAVTSYLARVADRVGYKVFAEALNSK
jgi:peptidyl-prolyl cis-trans isomerase C